ncbi:mitochondrial guide RNA binding complex subunit 2 [Trypanosoma conorhini]|uniref:Mitochondrial guide RNA binding complex subunit 2 n=1 Tax=Trypanosoma conorhini TaxID=83891 RepID=A0A3R7JY63_9TRYP|nr:mitochondrial guide RNA binding complex subunit 2 [Trypanosoma conorhini]RNE98740.1 mitochondrial guide RNA binding complex subunit 2 [Trypanosoma conorhini]
MLRVRHHVLSSPAVALRLRFSALLFGRRRQATSAVSGDFSHVTHNTVWGLWNEGNLFSLSVPELAFFLQEHCKVANVDPRAKKSALVRQVEEILSAEQANMTVQQEDNPHAVVVTDYDKAEEGLDEADEYGDWGAEPGFEDRRELDFMELSPGRMGERYDPLIPRSFQLMHSDVSSDVGIASIDPSKLPGHSKVKTALTPVDVKPNDANKLHFRSAFEWCLMNIWNMNMPGELNIGAGKVLYYRQVAKQNRNVMPLWTLQRHLYAQHPYAWFAIASESNVAAMESLASNLGMRLVQEPTTSYKVTIRRMNELFDCELNGQLKCTMLNKPWDRFLVSHYVRSKMPDLRYVVRARHPIKKRVSDAYLETDILRSTRDSVQSVLSPELGDVVYCCERVIRKWAMRTATGVTLQLVETKRTPLIITKAGDEGERLEYEWIVPLPQQAERIDVASLTDELWEHGNKLAEALEEGMEELMAHTMTAVSAY